MLARHGWDVGARVCRARHRSRRSSAGRHSIDLALRYLGLGAPTVVACDGQGDPSTRWQALAATDGPLLVALQAGEIHSGRLRLRRRHRPGPRPRGRVGPRRRRVRPVGCSIPSDQAPCAWLRASPTPGQRMPTRRSTFRTTPGHWRSWPIRWHTGRRSGHARILIRVRAEPIRSKLTRVLQRAAFILWATLKAHWADAGVGPRRGPYRKPVALAQGVRAMVARCSTTSCSPGSLRLGG